MNPEPIAVQQQSRTRFNQRQEFLQETPKETSFLEDLEPLLFVLKAIGWLPFYKQISMYEVAPPTKWKNIFSHFICLVIFAANVANICAIWMPSVLRSNASEKFVEEMFLNSIICSVMVFMCVKNAWISLNIINDILQVDEDIKRQYGTSLSNNCGFANKFLICTSLFTVYILILQIRDNEWTSNVGVFAYLINISCILQYVLFVSYIVYISAILRLVAVRFSFVNKILNCYSHVQQRSMLRYRQPRRLRELISMDNFADDSLFALRLHKVLLRIYNSINEFSSLVLVLYMGFAFYCITSTIYGLFRHFMIEALTSPIIAEYCAVSLTVNIALLILLVENCDKATKEANATSLIMARIYSTNKEYQNIVDKFLTKSIKQKVEFTANGFFVIDKSVLFTMFTAVTTYLVILIQFKQLENSKLEYIKYMQARNESI